MLAPDQAHYVGQVMRRKPGDTLEVFNAEDGGVAAEIKEVSRRAATLILGDQVRPSANDFSLTLCFAVIKRGPVETIVQKATELGVTTLQPIITARTVAKGLNADRLTAIAVEAAEQCERVSIPALNAPLAFAQALAERPEGTIIFADEAGDDPDQRWGGHSGRAEPLLTAIRGAVDVKGGACLFIGPEGGFTPEERTTLRAHEKVIPVRLGPRILRADTAAIAALALIQAGLGDWRS